MSCTKLLLLVSFLFIAIWLNGQIYSKQYEYKKIDWGIHVIPANYSNRGFYLGAGACKPIREKLMVQGNVGLLTSSFFELEPISTTGVVINPSLMYFPGRFTRYYGLMMGLELPVLYSKLHRDRWAVKTTTGPIETFQYERFETIDGSTFQTSLNAIVGIRLQPENQSFYFQPSLSIGINYRNLAGYTETHSEGILMTEFDRNFISQNDGIGMQMGIQILFGLYKFKKSETIKELEF